MEMIKVENLKKNFGSLEVLKDISLTVEKGDVIAILGPSGSGKSTFLRSLIDLEEADGGNIYIEDMPLCENGVYPKEKEKRKILSRMGMVFQDFRLLPNKTVYENVAFAMEIVGANSKQIRRRVSTVLSQTGLSEKWRFYPDQLSGGEQQRVGIARALVNNPKFIVADEPTGNLDGETADGIMELLDEINKCGTTIIMVTHSQQIVDRMKRRVIAIENGKVVKDEQGGYSYESL